MTKFIPVAFALVAFGASLSSAYAGPQGEPVVRDVAATASYQSVTPSTTPVRMTDAEAAIISQSGHQR